MGAPGLRESTRRRDAVDAFVQRRVLWECAYADACRSAYKGSHCSFSRIAGSINRSGKTMDAALDEELTALEAVRATATRSRELAQDRIVRAFRSQLEGAGSGPSDAEVQSFARFVLVEKALQKEVRGLAELIALNRLAEAPETVQ